MNRELVSGIALLCMGMVLFTIAPVNSEEVMAETIAEVMTYE